MSCMRISNKRVINVHLNPSRLPEGYFERCDDEEGIGQKPRFDRRVCNAFSFALSNSKVSPHPIDVAAVKTPGLLLFLLSFWGKTIYTLAVDEEMEIKTRKPIDELFSGNCTRSIIHTAPDPWHKLPVKLSGFVFRYACIIPLSTIQSPSTRVDTIIKPNVYLNPLPHVVPASDVIAINGTETLYHIFLTSFSVPFSP